MCMAGGQRRRQLWPLSWEGLAGSLFQVQPVEVMLTAALQSQGAVSIDR